MQTAGALREVVRAGGSCAASCNVCQAYRPVDLDALIAARGEAFSLVNVLSSCPDPDCPGTVSYWAGQPNTPHLPLRDSGWPGHPDWTIKAAAMGQWP
jgi:hypothetical protein